MSEPCEFLVAVRGRREFRHWAWLVPALIATPMKHPDNLLLELVKGIVVGMLRRYS